jgi:hypothetical protein
VRIFLIVRSAFLLEVVVVFLGLREVGDLCRICISFAPTEKHTQSQQLLQSLAKGLMMSRIKAGD